MVTMKMRLRELWRDQRLEIVNLSQESENDETPLGSSPFGKGHEGPVKADDGFKDRKRKRQEDNVPAVTERVKIKTEPCAESILEPVKKQVKTGEESSIGPKLSIDRSAFRQLAVLFMKSPIPSNFDLSNISRATGVSAKDVKWWFIKIRHRVKVNNVGKDQIKSYLDSIRICHDSNGIISL